MRIVKSRFYHLYFQDMVACLDFFHIFEKGGGSQSCCNNGGRCALVWFEPPVVALNPTGCQQPTMSQ